jgi:hypothetical protein
MSVDVITKAPTDLLDFDFNFSRWLPSGDRITSADALLQGTTAVVDHIDSSDAVARIWIAACADGDHGAVTVTISTLQGRTKQVSAILKIREP